MSRKKKYDYFAAFEKQMDYAMQELDVLIDVIDHFETAEQIAEIMPKAHEIEHAADEINHATFSALVVDFITPLDREDIVAIATLLDEITDDVEELIRMFYMLNVSLMHHDVLQNIRLIRQSCEALQVALHEFVNRKQKKKFHEAIDRVNECEEEADILYEEEMRRLYTVDADNPLQVIIWTRIFDHVEKICDDCEHVSDLISNIRITSS